MKTFKLTKENLTTENVKKSLRFVGTVIMENTPEVREMVKNEVTDILKRLQREAKEKKIGFWAV